MLHQDVEAKVKLPSVVSQLTVEREHMWKCDCCGEALKFVRHTKQQHKMKILIFHISLQKCNREVLLLPMWKSLFS
jgi:hypothetical protein